jgi:DNA-binding PadR family transcriptional regulator
MIEELGRHGYKVSAGTLYPILHGLEERGYLTSIEERSGSVARRIYRATALGKEVLAAAKLRVRELFGELFERDVETRTTEKRATRKKKGKWRG